MLFVWINYDDFLQRNLLKWPCSFRYSLPVRCEIQIFEDVQQGAGENRALFYSTWRVSSEISVFRSSSSLPKKDSHHKGSSGKCFRKLRLIVRTNFVFRSFLLSITLSCIQISKPKSSVPIVTPPWPSFSGVDPNHPLTRLQFVPSFAFIYPLKFTQVLRRPLPFLTPRGARIRFWLALRNNATSPALGFIAKCSPTDASLRDMIFSYDPGFLQSRNRGNSLHSVVVISLFVRRL